MGLEGGSSLGTWGHPVGTETAPEMGSRLPRWSCERMRAEGAGSQGAEPQVSVNLAQDRHPKPHVTVGRQLWSSLRSGDLPPSDMPTYHSAWLFNHLFFFFFFFFFFFVFFFSFASPLSYFGFPC